MKLNERTIKVRAFLKLNYEIIKLCIKFFFEKDERLKERKKEYLERRKNITEYSSIGARSLMRLLDGVELG